ncbi:MAG: O-antigen ligase family protein [Sphingobacteriia bacterium]|nr:O-antigen ligase family protein [Sphingobacteriia bacterium]
MLKIKGLKRIDWPVEESYQILFFCFLIAFLPLKDLWLHVLRMFIVLPLKLDVAIFYVLFGFVIFYSIRKVFSTYHNVSFFLLFFLIVFYTLAVLTPGHPQYIYTLGYQLATSYIVFLYARSIHEYENLNKLLRYTAPLISVSMFFLIFVFSMNEDTTYSQYTSYIVLPSAIISLGVIFNRFSFLHFSNFVLSVFLILVSGARGPLMCAVLFIIVRLALTPSIQRKLKIILLWAASFSLIAFFFGEKIIGIATGIILSKGLSTRILTFFISDEVLVDSGRELIRKFVLQQIYEHPFFGVGMGLDRAMINRHIGNTAAEAIGDYPHNIFLELLMQYGIFIGGLLIVILIRLTYKALKLAKDYPTSNVISIFMAIGLFPLLFSGSYINAPLFFAFLGFAVATIHKSRYQIKTS